MFALLFQSKEGDGFVCSCLLYTSSMGTAVIGGIAMGIFENERAVKKFHEVEAISEPNPEAHEVYKKIIPLFDKAYYCQVDLFEDMAALKL